RMKSISSPNILAERRNLTNNPYPPLKSDLSSVSNPTLTIPKGRQGPGKTCPSFVVLL
ncbi:4337_t:CDS:1, partial [Scutellospora calospora]